MSREEMEEELEQFYEAAGFADFYEKVLKNKTDKEIKEMYEKLTEDYNI